MVKKYIMFHSKSGLLSTDEFPTLPRDTGKMLSNFAPLSIQWRGHRYATVEHAFQGAKYLFSNKPEIEKSFRIGGSIGSDPVMAKKAGGQSGMAKVDAVLNVPAWEEASEMIMKELVIHKVACNPVIQEILRFSHQNHIRLFHYSRSDMKWGCYIDHITGQIKKGRNLLGKIYMEIAACL
jgi:ribA/ribD-fused uncharacterized protein